LGSKRRSNAWKKTGKKGGKKKNLRMPPELETVVTCHTVLRFTATSAASNVNATIANLLVACGSICTIANSTVTSVASSLRLHRVTIWPSPQTAGSGQQAEVLWPELGNTTRDESKSVAIPSGLTMADVISDTPAKNTVSAFWNSSGGGASPLFTITCPAGSIVDVSITFTLRNNISGVTQAGYAAAGLGSYYYGRLDGVGGKFLPLGVPTTN